MKAVTNPVDPLDGTSQVSLLTSAPTGEREISREPVGVASSGGADGKRLSPCTAAPPATESGHVLLDILAALLEYPQAGFQALCRLCAGLLPCAHDSFGEFKSLMEAMTADQREELYTATFDVTPVCAPYASIHLFGEENFKRGEFMAALSVRLQEAGVDRRGELPDHLSVLLYLAARLNPAERRELTAFVLLSSLRKMIGAIAPENPYSFLLSTAREVLLSLHPGITPVPAPMDQIHRCGPVGKMGGCASGGCGILNENP